MKNNIILLDIYHSWTLQDLFPFQLKMASTKNGLSHYVAHELCF